MTTLTTRLQKIINHLEEDGAVHSANEIADVLEEVKALEKYLPNVLRWIDESDYCYFCDEHPSHGHSEDCPVLLLEMKA